ncbi:hypothetical protein [Bradyrhizobium brasilense]|uniref:Transposase n=1 Tax=Bradyrhizobium brasilense TaxID=1419277 RepID=A0ABY8JM07_9BRAD|nr:hypothetical protein [Bradyrhizobium brasilense]WFU66695.1 hypothetical protein QA636_14780 [Bradyrhizobium brasilense]
MILKPVLHDLSFGRSMPCPDQMGVDERMLLSPRAKQAGSHQAAPTKNRLVTKARVSGA